MYIKPTTCCNIYFSNIYFHHFLNTYKTESITQLSATSLTTQDMHRNTETSKLNIKGGGEPNRRRTTEKPQKLTIYRKKPVSNNMKPK